LQYYPRKGSALTMILPLFLFPAGIHLSKEFKGKFH
jgi:hypothetical protein